MSSSAWFAKAAASLTTASARSIGTGMRLGDTPKFSTARCVWAPQNASAGIATFPIESDSYRTVSCSTSLPLIGRSTRRRWNLGRVLCIVTHMLRKASTLLFLLLVVGHSCAEDRPSSTDRLPQGLRYHDTEHIRIVFAPEDRRSAVEVAGFADRVFDRVTEFYRYVPDERVLCVIRGDTDFANGSFHPLPPHINLITSAPSGPWMGAATESWLKAVFAHELAHYLQLTEPSGLFGTTSRLLGPSVPSAVAGFMPGWLIEGSPVYVETLLTQGGRGRNQFFEMYARALLLEETFFSYAEAGHESRFPPPGRIYLAGYLIHEHFIETYGVEAFREMLERFVGFPLFGPRRAIKRATGIPAHALFQHMVDDLEHEYAAARDDRQDRALRITPAVTGNYYLPRQTDRGWLVYRSRLDRPRGIVELDPETGAETPLFRASLSDGYSFDTDAAGDTVVFASPVSEYAGGDTVVSSDLFVYDRATGAVERMTRRAHLRHPAVSPDGSQLVAVRQEGSYASLVSVDRETGRYSVILRLPETNLFTPVFSSDGTSIMFVANRRGRQEIGRVRADTIAFIYQESNRSPIGEESVTWLTDTPDRAEYYPRESDGIVTYGADGRHTLELWAYDTETDTHLPIRSDPIGAFAGFVDDGNVVFATYSKYGYALKRAPFDDAAFETSTPGTGPQGSPDRAGAAGGVDGSETRRGKSTSAAGTSSAAGASAADASSAGTHFTESAQAGDAEPPAGRVGSQTIGTQADPYRDLPRLAFWLPTPFVLDPFTGALTAFGPGALAYARAPVGGHTVEGEISLRPGVWQPSLRVVATLNPSGRSASLGLIHGYREAPDGAASQTGQVSLQGSLPIVGYGRYPVSRSLRFDGGIVYRLTQTADSPFPPFGGSDLSHTLLLDAGLSARFALRGSSLHPVPPWDLAAALKVEGAPLKPEPAYPAARATVAVSASAPIGTSNHVVSVAIDAGLRSNEYRLPAAIPAGGFVPETPPGLADGLLSLRYRTPVVPLDIALPLGFHLGGVRLELFGQAYGRLLPAPEADRFVYFGSEIEVEVGRTMDIPIALGIAVRLSTRYPERFEVPGDIRVYSSLGELVGTISGCVRRVPTHTAPVGALSTGSHEATHAQYDQRGLHGRATTDLDQPMRAWF